MNQDPLIPADVDDVLAQKATRGPRTPKPVHPYAHLASKHPDGIRATWCPTCHTPILAGLDAEVCAFTARTDPEPLNALGEALARIAGRNTYEIRTVGRVARLRYRNAGAITSRPAGAPAHALTGYDVVAAHTCHAATPEAATTASNLPANTDPKETTHAPY